MSLVPCNFTVEELKVLKALLDERRKLGALFARLGFRVHDEYPGDVYGRICSYIRKGECKEVKP